MSEINEEEVQNNSENKNIKQQPQVVPVIDHRLLAGKLTVYNWMEDTPEGCTPSEIVEVRFKNTRKGFYLKLIISHLANTRLLLLETNVCCL